MRRLDDIARGLLAQLARDLKLSHEFFDPLLSTAGQNQHDTESASILDTIHYMPPSTDRVNPNLSSDCESHVDKGLLTVIYPDTEQGLQVTHSLIVDVPRVVDVPHPTCWLLLDSLTSSNSIFVVSWSRL